MKDVVSKISDILYEIDPMGIGTVENELYDEYDLEATNILEYISHGMALEQSIIKTFIEQFDIGISTETLEIVSDLIKKVM